MSANTMFWLGVGCGIVGGSAAIALLWFDLWREVRERQQRGDALLLAILGLTPRRRPW